MHYQKPCVCAHAHCIHSERRAGQHLTRVSRSPWLCAQRLVGSMSSTLMNQNAGLRTIRGQTASENKSYFSLSSSAVPLSGNIEEMASKILSEGNFRGGRLSLSIVGNKKGEKDERKQVFRSFISSTQLHLTELMLYENHHLRVSLTSDTSQASRESKRPHEQNT